MSFPKEVLFIIKTLEEAHFEAYLVGGCVRDLLRNLEPKDWDIATNATPKEIQQLFPRSFYDNKFFTVKVATESTDPRLKEIEITTFRSEAKYTDRRHPDEIKPAKTIEEDLSRRDFTVNAMAMKLTVEQPVKNIKVVNYKIIDLFKGKEDLKNKIIRAVGEPKERFAEDALRMIRAVRFAATLNNDQFSLSQQKTDSLSKLEWQIESNTLQAIKRNASLLEFVSKERIRDELIKILESPYAAEGILLLHQTGLLKYIIPELEKGVGITQNKHHIYTIFKHSLMALKYAAKYHYNLNVRLAALLHDVAKPQTKRGEGLDATFYNHDVVGAAITQKILSRLKFPKKTIKKVTTLVRYHMFFYDPKTVTESSVRRLLKKVGTENIQELIQLRICDRKGMGRPKAKPYKLRYLEYIISRVSKDPISVKMLKVDGQDVMKILNIKSGPKVGLILNALLSEVIDDPQKNNKKYLEKRIKELGRWSEEELREKEKRIEEKKMEIETEEKQKFHIK
ncbi:MAG TPA: HD domain-containing protein [Candidatus Paceibacterota bacterium]|nr:HD domain-containing protein [Candidatus Paceibacterota bacterium]